MSQTITTYSGNRDANSSTQTRTRFCSSIWAEIISEKQFIECELYNNLGVGGNADTGTSRKPVQRNIFTNCTAVQFHHRRPCSDNNIFMFIWCKVNSTKQP